MEKSNFVPVCKNIEPHIPPGGDRLACKAAKLPSVFECVCASLNGTVNVKFFVL